MQHPGILENHTWNPNKESLPSLFGFNSDAIICNILIGSVCPIHIPLLYWSMRNGCGTAILVWVSLFHLCLTGISSLESQSNATYNDLLSFHPTKVSSFPVVVLRSISPRLNLFIWGFFCCCCCFVMMQLPSWFSLTIPEARILFEAKNFRRQSEVKVVHENYIANILWQNI